MSDLMLSAVLVSVAVATLLAFASLRALLADPGPEAPGWRDRPPRYWRIAAPLVVPAARLIGPLLPSPLRSGAARLLRHAGLDRALDAAQLVAGSLVAAIACGVVAALLVLRAGAMQGTPVIASTLLAPLAIAVSIVLGAWLPLSWTIDRRARRRRAVLRALPFYLDVITLSVESGANLTGALQHAAAKGPIGPLQVEIERVLRDVRAGRTRADALRALSDRLELAPVASWVSALVAAERSGSSLGPILRAQAEQRRQERFQHAEKLAMKAPVKLLLPLLVFFFPCTFVLVFFPVVVRLIEEGLLR